MLTEVSFTDVHGIAYTDAVILVTTININSHTNYNASYDMTNGYDDTAYNTEAGNSAGFGAVYWPSQEAKDQNLIPLKLLTAEGDSNHHRLELGLSNTEINALTYPELVVLCETHMIDKLGLTWNTL